METKILIDKMNEIAQGHMEAFQSDFDIDVQTLEKDYYQRPFVWIVRKRGTHLYWTDDVSEIIDLHNTLNGFQSDVKKVFVYDCFQFKEVPVEFIRHWAQRETRACERFKDASIVKLSFENGDHLTSRINTDLKGAKKYYLFNYFNVGNFEEDNMQRCIKVELLETLICNYIDKTYRNL